MEIVIKNPEAIKFQKNRQVWYCKNDGVQAFIYQGIIKELKLETVDGVVNNVIYVFQEKREDGSDGMIDTYVNESSLFDNEADVYKCYIAHLKKVYNFDFQKLIQYSQTK